MNISFWRNWLLLWALMPVFSAFFNMASRRLILDTVPIQPLHSWGIMLITFISGTFFLIAPYLVLRRYIKGYGFGPHCLAVFALLMSWGVAFWLISNVGSIQAFFRWEKSFSLALRLAKHVTPLLYGDIINLPWSKLLAHNLMTAAITFIGPVLVICIVAKRASSIPVTLLFFVLASAIVAVSEVLFDVFRIQSISIKNWGDLNGKPWPHRLISIASRSISSMFGACISAIAIARLLKQPDTDGRQSGNTDWHVFVLNLKFAGLTTAVLCGISAGFIFVFGLYGFSSNYAVLKKSLTSPPEKDLSVGENILTFSHFLNTNTYKFPHSNYVTFQLSPDNRSAVILEANGKNGSQLAVFDVKTGEKQATLSMPLQRNERVSFIWSKNKQHLIMRSRGKAIKTGRYPDYETKITLFSLPDYKQVSQWQSSEISCRNNKSLYVNMAEDDEGQLIVLCHNLGPERDNGPLAIQFSLPSLKVFDVRKYENLERNLQISRLIELGGVVYTPLRQLKHERSVLLANIANPELSVALDNPFAADRGGNLTFQNYVIDETTDDMIGMRLCGSADKVSNPPQTTTEAAWGPSICRIIQFNLPDGSYAGHTDGEETRHVRDNTRPREFSIPFKAWQFTGEVYPDSYVGKLKISDANNGAIIQTIESATQTPIITSEELGVLFTHHINTRKIAVYTIAK